MERITPDAYGHYEEVQKKLNFVLTEPSRIPRKRGEEILRIQEGEVFAVACSDQEESLSFLARKVLLGNQRNPFLVVVPVESKDVKRLNEDELRKKYAQKHGHILNKGAGVLRITRNKNVPFFETIFSIQKKRKAS